MIRATIFNEFVHERHDPQVKAVYPDGMHAVIAGFLNAAGGISARTATLEEPEHGLSQDVLDQTDVLLWWAHTAHGRVDDAIAKNVVERVVQGGMGFIGLHSAHFSKPFRRLMGTGCDLKWREIGEKEKVWVVNPAHPIAAGLPECIDIPHTEMYGEHFDIPQPDEQVLISWYQGGEVFRSGCCWSRGRGRVFYLSPGHESFPIYYQPEIQRAIINGVRWAAPSGGPAPIRGHIPVPSEIV